MRNRETALVEDGFRFYSNLASREPLLSRGDEFNLGKRINDAYAHLFCLVLGTSPGVKQLEAICQKLEGIDLSKERTDVWYNGQKYVILPEEVDQFSWIKSYYGHDPWEIKGKETASFLDTHTENLAVIMAGKNKNHLQELLIDPVEERLKRYQDFLWGRYNSLAEPYRNQIEAYKNTFVNANLRLVIDAAKHYLNRGVYFLDLVSAGNEGLMHAVGMFDYTMNTKFSTFATNHITACIRRKIRSDRTIRVPDHTIYLIGKIKKTSAEFKEEHGYSPSLAELARLLEKEEKTIRRAMQLADRPLSLDEEINDEDLDGDGYTLYNLVEDKTTPSPLESAIADSNRIFARKLINRLEPRQQVILRMRFGIGYDQTYTLEEVGDKIGLTRERVRQIEAESLAKLRQQVTLETGENQLITINTERNRDNSARARPSRACFPELEEEGRRYEKYRFKIFKKGEQHLQLFLEAQMEDNPNLTSYVNFVRRTERLIGEEVTSAFREIWFDFSELVGEVLSFPSGYHFLKEAIERLTAEASDANQRRSIKKEEANKYRTLLLTIEGPDNISTEGLPKEYNFERVFAPVRREEGEVYYAQTFFPLVHLVRRNFFEKEVIGKVISELKKPTALTEVTGCLDPKRVTSKLARIENLQRSISRNERLVSEGYQKPLLHHSARIAEELGVSLEECIQAGNIGLNQRIKEHRLFDPHNFAFKAFYGCIYAIYRELLRDRKAYDVDLNRYRLVNKAKDAPNQLSLLDNLVPTTEQLAKKMNCCLEYVESLRPFWQEDFEVGLDVLEEEDSWIDEEGLREYSGLTSAAEEPSVETNLSLEELMSSLDPRTQEILKLRFGLYDDDPLTLEEVGQRFNLTRERIRQLEAQGLKKIRARLNRGRYHIR